MGGPTQVRHRGMHGTLRSPRVLARVQEEKIPVRGFRKLLQLLNVPSNLPPVALDHSHVILKNNDDLPLSAHEVYDRRNVEPGLPQAILSGYA
eukprot:scaffold3190_cov409-Prasinococcus_capsulatus_cf.AAC.12